MPICRPYSILKTLPELATRHIPPATRNPPAERKTTHWKTTSEACPAMTKPRPRVHPFRRPYPARSAFLPERRRPENQRRHRPEVWLSKRCSDRIDSTNLAWNCQLLIKVRLQSKSSSSILLTS